MKRSKSKKEVMTILLKLSKEELEEMVKVVRLVKVDWLDYKDQLNDFDNIYLSYEFCKFCESYNCSGTINEICPSSLWGLVDYCIDCYPYSDWRKSGNGTTNQRLRAMSNMHSFINKMLRHLKEALDAKI